MGHAHENVNLVAVDCGSIQREPRNHTYVSSLNVSVAFGSSSRRMCLGCTVLDHYRTRSRGLLQMASDLL